MHQMAEKEYQWYCDPDLVLVHRYAKGDLSDGEAPGEYGERGAANPMRGPRMIRLVCVHRALIFKEVRHGYGKREASELSGVRQADARIVRNR
jgi:hypothetical protein